MVRLYYIVLEAVQAALIFLPVLWLVQHFAFHRELRYILEECIFGFYILSVFAAVGFPSFWYFVVDFGMNLIPFAWLVHFSTGYMMNMILNVVLFLPFGLLLPMLGERWKSLKTVTLTGFLFSFFIEIMQFFSFRTTDVDDLIMNTFGAAAGFGIWKLLSKKTLVQKLQLDCGRLETAVIFVAAVIVKFFVSFSFV